MDLGNWFEDEALTVDVTTLANFEKMIDEYLAARQVKEDMEAKVSEQGVLLRKMEGKLKQHFEAQGLTTFKTRAGNLILNDRTSYKAPDGEGRQDCIEKLRETGELENILGFNAAKFSSWYKAQKDANPEYQIEGVREERIQYMSFRPTK